MLYAAYEHESRPYESMCVFISISIYIYDDVNTC